MLSIAPRALAQALSMTSTSAAKARQLPFSCVYCLLEEGRGLGYQVDLCRDSCVYCLAIESARSDSSFSSFCGFGKMLRKLLAAMASPASTALCSSARTSTRLSLNYNEAEAK